VLPRERLGAHCTLCPVYELFPHESFRMASLCPRPTHSTRTPPHTLTHAHAHTPPPPYPHIIPRVSSALHWPTESIALSGSQQVALDWTAGSGKMEWRQLWRVCSELCRCEPVSGGAAAARKPDGAASPLFSRAEPCRRAAIVRLYGDPSALSFWTYTCLLTVHQAGSQPLCT
jgi:hypothetical protein